MSEHFTPEQSVEIERLRGLRSDLRVEVSVQPSGKILAQATWTHNGDSHNVHAFGKDAVAKMLTGAFAAIRLGKA